jgi:hypothetical protein
LPCFILRRVDVSAVVSEQAANHLNRRLDLYSAHVLSKWLFKYTFRPMETASRKHFVLCDIFTPKWINLSTSYSGQPSVVIINSNYVSPYEHLFAETFRSREYLFHLSFHSVIFHGDQLSHEVFSQPPAVIVAPVMGAQRSVLFRQGKSAVLELNDINGLGRPRRP